jgi:hypothetical protein
LEQDQAGEELEELEELEKSEEGEGEGDAAAYVDKLLRALVLYRRSPDVRFLAARCQKIL